ncbi:MAG: hypothetical protein JWM71_1428, partial [Solirubrobacteraceae bacterium]|nr:hypothetical protein [Solirubrobacteraceae bacterium]
MRRTGPGAPRTSGSRRGFAGFGVALFLAAAGGAIVASAHAAPVPASVPLVILHRDHVARSAPRPH